MSAPGPAGPPAAQDIEPDEQVGDATLPEAAGRRLAYESFTSGLSVNEFAACLHMGMRPVGLVQGFCAMRWVWRNVWGAGYASRYSVVGYRTRTITSYDCPHYWQTRREADHRSWGANEEVITMEAAWEAGFGTALERMIAEARQLGAHGVVGVVDASHPLIDAGIREFHLTGTAVVVEGEEPSGDVWSTFLAGQRLAKLLEAGLAPVSVMGAVGAVAILPICVTELRERGRYDPTGIVNPEGEIAQISDAHMAVRRVARDRIRHQIGHDSLHGADLRTEESYLGSYKALFSTLRGTRVRRYADVDPLPPPVPTVRLT
jgi:hypothetical protein